MDKKKIAEELVLKFRKITPGSPYTGVGDIEAKECALILCEELAKRLPSINDTPPIHRLSDENYRQCWIGSIPNAINANGKNKHSKRL